MGAGINLSGIPLGCGGKNDRHLVIPLRGNCLLQGVSSLFLISFCPICIQSTLFYNGRTKARETCCAN